MKLERWLSLLLLVAVPAMAAEPATRPPEERSVVERSVAYVTAIPGEIAAVPRRLATAAARSLGLLHGTWGDREALRATLDAFVAMDDAAALKKPMARFSHPMFRRIGSVVRATQLAEGGEVDAARRMLGTAPGARTSRDAWLAAEGEVVLLGSRAAWPRVALRCLTPDSEFPPGLFADDEVLYRCTLAAAAAREWDAALELADRVPDESEFQAYALYSAAAAARDAEQFAEAVDRLERVAGHSADRNRRLTGDVELRRTAVIDGYGPARLLEERALAALVLLHAEAKDPVEANRALARMSPESPWYPQALAGLPELRWIDLRTSVKHAQTTPKPTLLLLYGQALLVAGRPDLASDLMSTHAGDLESSRWRPADRPSRRWVDTVLEVESTRVAREKHRRRAIADRAWAMVGVIGTRPGSPAFRAPEPSAAERDQALQKAEPLLGPYLADEGARQVVRTCLRQRAARAGCSGQVEASYGYVRDRWIESMQNARYEMDRLLADALFERTVGVRKKNEKQDEVAGDFRSPP